MKRYNTGTLKRLRSFALLLCVLTSCICRSQVADTTNVGILQPSLNDILNIKPDAFSENKVTIANLVETNVYEAPNVVSIITEEDIKALGMRDLLDVLNTIPGINIANDVQNGTSIGIRGMWAEEGKVLFMINSLVMNDMAYGSIILGHRFPLSNIKRIEVIRGAGSSIYGGLAALAVINIITKSGQETNGHSLNIGGGISNKHASRGILNYNYGGSLINKIELTASAMVNAGNRSNEMYRLPDSTLTNFRDSSAINNVHLLFTLKYKQLMYKQIYEDYNFQSTYEPISSLCRTSISDISNNFQFKKLGITPFINYKWQTPWNTQYGNPQIYDYQNLITRRFSVGFNTVYNPLLWLNIMAGSQFYNDSYRHFRKTLKLKNGKLVENYNGFIAYAEASVSTKFVNINLGGRFDQYAYFKPNVLPRVSLAKSFKKWHYKLLYGESFKIPSLQNINLDVYNNLVPENITDIQAEVGLHTKLFDLNVTVFENIIRNIIVFGYDKNFNESYINSNDATIRGLELEGKIKLGKFSLKTNHSFYRLVACNTNEIMVDTLDLTKGTLAFPTYKLVANLIYKINEKNSLCLNYVFKNQKYGFERINSVSGEYGMVNYPSTHLVNLTYQRNGLFKKLLDINIGVYNIFNTKTMYVYPFREGYSSVIGMGRELFVNLKLNF